MFVARNRVHVAFGTFVNQNVEYRGAFVPRETRYAVRKKQAYRIWPFCKQNERALSWERRLKIEICDSPM